MWKKPLLAALLILSCEKTNKNELTDQYEVLQTNDDSQPTLINGEVLDTNEWPFIVNIRTGNSGCSATVVGPRVLITASHCGTTGATTTAKVGGKDVKGKFERSPLYPRQDHDVAVVVLEEEIKKEDAKVFVSVGGIASVGAKNYLAGYGCTQAGGGGSDGKLRGGLVEITGFSGFDVVSGGKDGSPALCFGDSGGPMLVEKNNQKPKILGINSKGNIRNTNYNTRLDIKESRDFLSNVASVNSVVICGINGTKEVCEDDSNPPPPPPPPPPGDCDDTVKKQLLLTASQCLGIPILIHTHNR
jgi:hypothetical protein